MCRFACFLGNNEILLSDFIIKPCHSIMFQSFGCKERTNPLNGDGFGIAWYAPQIRSAPGIFKAITPAWSNRNLINLCGVTKSSCIVAHVRAATQGLSVSESNCHPFSYERLSFVHNGEIANWKALKRQLVHMISEDSFNHIEGSTDSEHIFALFLDQYKKYNNEGDHNSLVKATVDTIAIITELAKPFSTEADTTLNLAITDGSEIVCTRFSTGQKHLSLYYSPKVNFETETKAWSPVLNEPSACYGTVVASEPLNGDRSSWIEIPKNHLLFVDRNLQCSTRAL